MEYFEEDGGGKVYNRDVLKLIFRYTGVYKKQLFLALGLVFVITGANLSVPFLFRTIIDRFIFKQGRIVYLNGEEETLGRRSLRRALPLNESHLFLFQSELKFYSEREIDEFIRNGILSSETFLLLDPERSLPDRMDGLLENGEARIIGVSLLIRPSLLNSFTTGEVLELRGGDFTHIVRYVLIITAVLLLQFGSSYLQIVILMRLAQNAMKDLRRDLFSHIVRLRVSYFDSNPIGTLVNRVTNDIERLNELFSSVLVTFFQDLLMMLGIIVIMYLTNRTLAFYVSSTFPFLILITVLFRIKVRNAYRRIRTRIGALNGFLNETITGIRVVQIFVREAANLLRFRDKNNDVFEAQLGQLYVNAVFRPLIGFMRWIAVAAVLYFGAGGIVQNKISFGLLVMFIAYIERFFNPVQDLSEKFDIMQSANAAGEKIISVLGVKATERIERSGKGPFLPKREAAASGLESGSSGTSRGLKGSIEFKDVWFSYKPDEWVLKGISFKVDPHETLAVVGETGAGKTTIINLLTGFYKPQRGGIYIDGRDIDTLPTRTLRTAIASVMQDVFLFSSDVKHNVTLAKPFDRERFSEVSKITHIDAFIQNLPMKENERVMERGVSFSAGERQLLSFARALYFDPAILVLDEATSNIDSETEKYIQEAIEGLLYGRTSIVIAHRLSTVSRADRIIVLERGHVVEEGTHKQLLKKDGFYAKYYRLQFGSSRI